MHDFDYLWIHFLIAKLGERTLTWGHHVLTWGRRVPASAFAWQGSMPWQANTIHFLIAKLGYRTPNWQCRRGDASPPGEDAPTLQKINARKKPLSTNLLKEACKKVGGDLLSRGCAVPSARLGLTSLFGMGRGDPQRYNHQNIFWTTLSLKY